MKPWLRWTLVGMAVVVGVALFGTGAQRLVERNRTANEVNRLREELYRARVGSDRCRGQLARSESALLSLSQTIDELRAQVDSYEALDARGVPSDRYDDYLEVFESYNDSVEVWETRERRLRAAEASCRETIQMHNALSDSLQQVLRDAGIESG